MTWHNVMKSSKLKPGKKKMMTVKGKMVMVGRQGNALFATEALCAATCDGRLPGGRRWRTIASAVRFTKPRTTWTTVRSLSGRRSRCFQLTASWWAPCRRRRICEFTKHATTKAWCKFVLRPRRTHPLFPLNERLPHQFTSIFTSIEDVAHPFY